MLRTSPVAYRAASGGSCHGLNIILTSQGLQAGVQVGAGSAIYGELPPSPEDFRMEFESMPDRRFSKITHNFLRTSGWSPSRCWIGDYGRRLPKLRRSSGWRSSRCQIGVTLRVSYFLTGTLLLRFCGLPWISESYHLTFHRDLTFTILWITLEIRIISLNF